jgi:hypothetical protein
MTRDVRPVVRTASLLVAGFVLAGVSVLQGQSATLDPQTIVARHVEAIGGAAAFRAISSTRATGTFELTGQGMTGSIEALSARPAKQRLTINIAAIGRIDIGYDGKHGWEIDPTQGPALLSGRRLSEMADDAVFDLPLHEPARVQSMTAMGREGFDRRQAHKIKVVLVSGNEQIEYYDVETGLMLGYEATRVTPMGAVPVTVLMRDYKKFGALMQTTMIIQRTLGFEQIVRFTAIEYNTVPANAFDPPPAIKALIGK